MKLMKIKIGYRIWTAKYIWVENGRFCWLSTGGRRHSRKCEDIRLLQVTPL